MCKLSCGVSRTLLAGRSVVLQDKVPMSCGNIARFGGGSDSPGSEFVKMSCRSGVNVLAVVRVSMRNVTALNLGVLKGQCAYGLPSESLRAAVTHAYVVRIVDSVRGVLRGRCERHDDAEVALSVHRGL
jgi:hypothetical protein